MATFDDNEVGGSNCDNYSKASDSSNQKIQPEILAISVYHCTMESRETKRDKKNQANPTKMTGLSVSPN